MAQNKVKELEQKCQELNNKYLYLYADFENFRRRNEQERINMRKFGSEDLLKDLLQVADNFDRAVVHAKSSSPEKGSALANVLLGIEMIQYQLMEAMRAQGVTQIKSLSAKFDPNFHEAVGEEAADAEAGTVLKEELKGFMLHDRLLRAAKVITAKKN